MAIVIDASIALAWCLPDERSADADRVLDQLVESGQAMLVPRLWVQETANAIVSALRRGRLTEAQAQRCVDLIAGLAVEFDGTPADQAALVAASIGNGLSAYDATYLLLAERSGSPLASLDQRLVDTARAAGVAILP